VLDGALEASRNLIEAGHHALEVDLEDSTLEVDVDETRMTQVFTNLLNNAAKYTPDGGSIRVHAARDGSQAVIRVLDDGVGLSTWMLPHVFDLFTQGPRTLDRSEGGLGIGLSLVRHLVALHGGSVEATSPGAGKGSTFTVRIPLAAG
jgi:signal transduction histidine kinase